MFSPEDPILVGVSGGKDSLALLHILSTFHPNLYSIHVPIHTLQPTVFSRFCEQRSLYFAPQITVFSMLNANVKKPCYNCSRIRRKMILEYAQAKGIRKIAFAHHRDDVIETFFLNLLYQNELSTMLPRQVLMGGDFEIIRPFYLVPEHLIRQFAQSQQLPVAVNQCGYEDLTRRDYVRKLIANMQREHPGREVRDHLFRSILHPNTDFMPSL